MPSSILARAPCLLNLIITPVTTSSFLYFLAASVQGFSFNAFNESEILPSFISIILTLTESPTVANLRGSSTRPQSISEICTNPSSPSSILTKTPKSTTPVTSPTTSSPKAYLSTISIFSLVSIFFSEKISLFSFGMAVMMQTAIFCPTSLRNSSKILSLSPSVTLG